MTLATRTRLLQPLLLAASVLLSACASNTPQGRTSATPTATRTLSGNADDLAGDALQALAESDGQAALAAIARANLKIGRAHV